jgi:hypothetical protein
MPNESTKSLNRAVAGGQSIDDIMREAKRFLGKRTVVDEANAAGANEHAQLSEMNRLESGARVAPVLARAGKAALLPAAFLGGPVGMAAGGALAFEGINDAMNDPSAGNVAVAGLGMLPFAKPVKGLLKGLKGGMRGGKAADLAGEVDRFMPNTSGAPGKTISRTPKAPVAYREPTSFNPSEAHMPNTPGTSGVGQPGVSPSIAALDNIVQPHMANTPGTVARGVSGVDDVFRHEDVVERFMPNQGANLPKAAPEGEDAALDALLAQFDTSGISMVDEGATALNASGDSAASLEALSRAKGMSSRGEQFGVYDRAGRFRKLIGPEAVDYTPVAGETYGVLEAGGGFRTLNNQGGRVMPRGQRPPADYVHPADDAGTQFGFDQLPEISEGELTRLQQLFKRLGR